MKKASLVMLSALMIVALAACGVNNQGAGTRDGYGTMQNNNQSRTGILGNGTNNSPYGYGNNTYGYGNTPYGYGSNMYRNGMDNDGMTGNRGNMGTNNDYSRVLARALANSCNRISGVERATAIVYGNDIVIGIQSNNNNNNNTMNRDLERKVRQNIQQLVPNMNVHVTSDKNMMRRITDMDRQMGDGNGAGLRNIGNDFATLVRDIGRTITQPFR